LRTSRFRLGEVLLVKFNFLEFDFFEFLINNEQVQGI